MYFQFRRYISKTLLKAKDGILTYLHRLVREFVLPPGPISNKQAKVTRVEKLKSLVENKEKFLYRPAIYNQNSEKTRGPHDPYCGPYIRNALRILFFEHRAPFEDVPYEELTVPMIAFISTLVRSYLI